MPVVIELLFPAGRYHATPWGKHVNEGAVEWPPSPWRLLRSVLASWKLRTEFDDQTLASILLKLARPPEFRLPPATVGHTRHYMPLYKGERTLIFDTFAVLDRSSSVHVIWPAIDLSASEKEFLSIALDRLNHFGRSESWCDARLLDNPSLSANCFPLDPALHAEGTETVRVLGVDPGAILAGKAVESWPLCAGTAGLRKQKWSDPPGAVWHTYVRSLDCLSGGAPRSPAIRSHRFDVARFVLSSSVLPLVTESLSIGEFARIRLQGIYGRQNDGATSEVLSGKRPDGTRVPHDDHAFFHPTDEDRDGRLDHLTVFSRAGFGARELAAFDRFRALRQIGKGRPDLDVVLAALGSASELRDARPLRCGKLWRSVTPYVPVRHTKHRRSALIDTPEQQLAREISLRGLPAPSGIRPVGRDARGKRWLEYRLERVTGDGSHGQLYGHGFELEFPIEVSGPLALGYACHFGLGQFQSTAADEA